MEQILSSSAFAPFLPRKATIIYIRGSPAILWGSYLKRLDW